MPESAVSRRRRGGFGFCRDSSGPIPPLSVVFGRVVDACAGVVFVSPTKWGRCGRPQVGRRGGALPRSRPHLRDSPSQRPSAADCRSVAEGAACFAPDLIFAIPPPRGPLRCAPAIRPDARASPTSGGRGEGTATRRVSRVNNVPEYNTEREESGGGIKGEEIAARIGVVGGREKPRGSSAFASPSRGSQSKQLAPFQRTSDAGVTHRRRCRLGSAELWFYPSPVGRCRTMRYTKAPHGHRPTLRQYGVTRRDLGGPNGH